jgi:cytochrome P450
MTLLWRKYGLGDMFFLDNWPAAPERQIVINDPVSPRPVSSAPWIRPTHSKKELAAQITQMHSLPKHPLYKEYAAHICGETSMIFSEGEMWKQSRSLFNPGFSASHLMTLVPIIVDDTMIFWRNLNRVAESKEIVQLEQMTAHLTIDIMGHVILDHDLNSQGGHNKLVDAFRHAIEWTPSPRTINPLAGLNPIRPIAHWYWTSVMDGYIGKLVDERYKMIQADKIDKSRKCAIDLALAQHSPQQERQKHTEAQKIDTAFKQIVIDGMKTFLFAGHDTSSSTICYVYHLLELYPEVLAKVIQEHDDVFGKDTSMTADKIKHNPQLLNQLPYTLAVIKGKSQKTGHEFQER